MRLPVSLQSLLVQCAAALATALLVRLLPDFFSVQGSPWTLALVQGTLAAGLSVAWRQPAWWPPLHFVFLPAVLLASRADLPAGVYLGAFVVLVLFYWSSFRTRVPLYLSGRDAWQTVAGLLPASQPFRFIDLGSGLGGMPLHLAERFPQGRFEGTEIAPAPWAISRLRAWLTGNRVRFMRRDYGTLDLSAYDVVFAFLSPAAMPGLWRQAQAQMRPGSLLLSLAFPADGRRPDEVLGGAAHALYVWRM